MNIDDLERKTSKFNSSLILKKIYRLLINGYKFRNNKYLTDRKRIKKFYNIHKGERCFIIGTGPSINDTNLSLLKNETIFGVNSLVNGFNRFNTDCNYYCFTNFVSFKRYHKKLNEFNGKVFLAGGQEFIRFMRENKNLINFDWILLKHLGWIPIWKKISTDIAKGIYTGGTVILLCIQVAYYMGFNEVYLLGCDCDYSSGKYFDGENTRIKKEGMVGEQSFVFPSYKICKKQFEKDNRKIYNATQGGRLEIFERKTLEKI